MVLFSIILHWKYAITVIPFYRWRQCTQTDWNPWSTITHKLETSLDLLQSNDAGKFPEDQASWEFARPVTDHKLLAKILITVDSLPL